MKILVTGATGQLGCHTVRAFDASGHQVTGIGREQLDMGGPADISAVVAEYAADWIVNCAAYTQVDRAEEETGLAFAVNRDAARAIALGARQAGSRLLHVSTDFVFEGNRAIAYREIDKAEPVNVYGRSKLEGEHEVMRILPSALIIRSAWLYAAGSDNFVTTMLRLLEQRDEVQVVDDQIGSPTWAAELVRAMQVLMAAQISGTYHFSNEGVASWYDLACAVRAEARALGQTLDAEVRPIPSSQWPCPARRPAFSVLNKEKIRPLLGYAIPHWRESLCSMLQEQLS